MPEHAARAPLLGRLILYAKLVRLHRPIGIYLLLWPTLWALWLAGGGKVDALVLLVFVTGVILMRSAGCAINDYADRHFDGHVRRTQDRPLSRGALQPVEALAVFVILSLIAFALVLQLDWLTIQLSVVGALLAALYPFSKRYTHWPQVVLGMAFAWSVPMAYTAQHHGIDHNAWLLYLATVLWVIAYDTMYAMVDRQDDVKIGVKSTAVLFGRADRLIIGLLQGSFLTVLVLVGVRNRLGAFYYLALTASAALFVYQQWLIRDREPALCFKAFLNNNYVGVAVFAGLVANYAVIRP